ncbi:MAG: 6,7-dimethyl-8-ribityllumazine synthase [Myxococcales bacterium]|nr:6,7-dimethyl-8-ribityllumazine synthase [Myxococcales bacterium]
MKHFEAPLTAQGLRFGLVVSRFNALITERLLEGAMDYLVRHGAAHGDQTVVRVPGAWEMPLAVQWMAERQGVDGVIALGCVIRGGTPHFEYVAGEVAKGCAQVQMDKGLPVSFGVLTTDSIEQAVERAGTKHGNKGWEAAAAVVEMANLSKLLRG